VKAFAKNAIKYLIVFGWFFGLSEQIFLQRSFEKDKKVIIDAIRNFLTYPGSTCVMMPAEGTRFTKEKHEASIAFAEKNNIKPFKHHLIPRARGFITCVPILKENQDKISVLNMQIAFDPQQKAAPKLISIIRGEPLTAHIYLDIVPYDKIEATNDSLMKIYQEKDDRHDSFLKYGNFFEGKNEKIIEGIKFEPRIRALICTSIWFIINIFIITKFYISMINGGFIITLSLITIGSILAGIYNQSFILSKGEMSLIRKTCFL
jgi:lysophosphatidic acid acyltransferase / lysophosphatidylinositol acyltransferase